MDLEKKSERVSGDAQRHELLCYVNTRPDAAVLDIKLR
jgi:hypothetical protein